MAAKSGSHTDDDDDAKKVYPTKKVLFVDSYGVKRLPYKGRRKHFSSIQQILGSRRNRHNDLFGMSIFQFDREYKTCLERRKQNESRILNILFPFKTDNRYLEYLENTQSQQTVHASLFSPHEKEVYDNLISVVGSEMDIRIRQHMLLIIDKIYKKGNTNITRVFSGSLAEGLDLHGSDTDIMYVCNNVQVIQNVQHINCTAEYDTLLMEDDMEYPGFSRLKLMSVHGDIFKHVESRIGMFLSNLSIIRYLVDFFSNEKQSAHGPCFSNKDKSMDHAVCFHLHTWPRQAEQWIYRHRHGQWPSATLIDAIVNYGCLLVPIGPKEIENSEFLWRISFSMAEKQLSHAMNYTQILCYALLKLSLKNIIEEHYKVKDLLCSYFMKTAVLWLSEEMSINVFQLQNLFHCYLLCLDKIISWVKCCYCPNYFIPEHNMFRGKINRSNSRLLLNVLERLRNGERGLFTVTTLFNSETVLSDSCIKLELFLYTVIKIDAQDYIEKGYTQQLSFLKSLAMSQSSSILSGICYYYYAVLNQTIAQNLLFSTTNKHNEHVIRRYHKHLQDGTKSDAVTGWLLYASFYYVLGQYNTTLKIIDHVLSRCTPDMIMLNLFEYTTYDIKCYTQNVGCSNITLNEKMRLATIDDVFYVEQSTLIPHELKLEVQDQGIAIPPVVLSHCLRFLCYHHLNSIDTRQQSLRVLNLTIKERQFVYICTLSNSLTILGVCNEMVGNKEAAYNCYDTALKNDYSICHTAAKRKAKLDMT